MTAQTGGGHWRRREVLVELLETKRNRSRNSENVEKWGFNNEDGKNSYLMTLIISVN